MSQSDRSARFFGILAIVIGLAHFILGINYTTLYWSERIGFGVLVGLLYVVHVSLPCFEEELRKQKVINEMTEKWREEFLHLQAEVKFLKQSLSYTKTQIEQLKSSLPPKYDF